MGRGGEGGGLWAITLSQDKLPTSYADNVPGFGVCTASLEATPLYVMDEIDAALGGCLFTD